MSLEQKTQQQGSRSRPYWVYMWQEDLNKKEAFSSLRGWVMYDVNGQLLRPKTKTSTKYLKEYNI